MGGSSHSDAQAGASPGSPAAGANGRRSVEAQVPAGAARGDPVRRDGSVKTLFGIFAVKEHVTRANVVGLHLSVLFTITFLVFTSSMSAFILSDLIDKTDGLGDNAGSISFYDEIIGMLFVVVWGGLSGRVGRRIVYTIGFTIMGVAIVLYTVAKTAYPEYLLYRLLFAIGGAASSSMMTAVLSDYAPSHGSGKLTGTIGLCSGVGALVGEVALLPSIRVPHDPVFVLLPMPATLSARDASVSLAPGLRTTHYICGGLALVVAIGIWFLLRPSALARTRARQYFGEQNATSFYVSARGGLLEGGRNWRVGLSYAGGLVARGDSVVVSLFMPLWVNHWHITQGPN
ncbi:MAG: hypothetical protein BJ554DRAFT_5688 [Olpidium bornovanus]|uniref:Major facilitator superfamily (MFS) profile domain-containing protein n=1 Tax=Olpidium bornovanus TaxID=278681 RepID=A0A8H7ZYZ0_9FUNG|nr:MAG: hypothetical protein BJ554DRAFT_5688 [Olpidium bornovanus]